MSGPLYIEKFAQAVAEFNERSGRGDGTQVVPSLATGLAQIRDALYPRLHQDVERYIGKDSMRVPVSELRTAERTLREINLYQAAEAAGAAAQFGYLPEPRLWFTPWLAQLLLGEKNLDGENQRRLEVYQAQTPAERHRTFLNVLARALPESAQAPLVLFRLLPLTIQIAVAQAFTDHPRSEELRRQQITILPAIADCHQCRGRVMECVESCPGCGNPVWKYEWLRSAD
jgi:hypothetical protein